MVLDWFQGPIAQKLSASRHEGSEIQHRFVANVTEMTLEDDEGPGELRIHFFMEIRNRYLQFRFLKWSLIGWLETNPN